jgi:hypothetical protein
MSQYVSAGSLLGAAAVGRLSYPLNTFGDMSFFTGSPPLNGILLRYAVLDVMAGTTEPVRIADLVEAVEARGNTIPERKGKHLSDALRTEHRRGRVRRVGRDQYVAVEIPSSTVRRARRALLDRRRGLR